MLNFPFLSRQGSQEGGVGSQDDARHFSWSWGQQPFPATCSDQTFMTPSFWQAKPWVIILGKADAGFSCCMSFQLSYWESVYFNGYEMSSLVNIRRDFPSPQREESAEMFHWLNTSWTFMQIKPHSRRLLWSGNTRGFRIISLEGFIIVTLPGMFLSCLHLHF